ncbi:MAG: hypothetical protein KUG80_06795 [Gammaproteobacteria bacterium]|nr:hypothetical protein [Gammaproteobacteria bacterium]
MNAAAKIAVIGHAQVFYGFHYLFTRYWIRISDGGVLVSRGEAAASRKGGRNCAINSAPL